MKQPIIGILCLLSIGLFFVGAGATDRDELARLDPSLRILVLEAAGERDPAVAAQSLFDPDRYRVLRSPQTGEIRYGLLVKLDRPFFGDRYAGLPVLGSTGSILGMELTAAELVQLVAASDVVYIEPAWKARPHLDVSVPAIGAAQVHHGAGTVRGEGVIVGAVDTGIDYAHLDFRNDRDGDGFEESSRILAIWDQTFGAFGVRYSQEEIEADLAAGYGADEGTVRQADRDGHGTHVMGIAAGDGSSSAAGFVGVAPEASIVMVKTTFYTTDILEGVDYVFDLADAHGMPAVVNLSLGGHEGPHDGTSLFEQGLDELLQAASGRAITVSAGNEGDRAIHAAATLAGGSVEYAIDPDDTQVELSLWYPGASRFTVTIEPPGESAIVVPWGTETGVITTGAGAVRVDNAWAGPNPNNGDNEVYLRMYGLSGFADWTIRITDASGGGRFDMWVTSGTATLAGGDASLTIDEPGNADRVITVGAYVTKATWPSEAGFQDYTSQYTVGTLAEFSSHGPTRDGRTKPEVAAPGAWICAALSEDADSISSFAHPDGVHVVELGTSMAAPHAAGTIALMLAANPGLTTAEIRDILTSTAVQDAQTGFVPNVSWGWGKLDALAAVEQAWAMSLPPAPGDRPIIRLLDNPVSSRAEFAYSVPEGAHDAVLRIYDVAGSLVFEAPVEPEDRFVTWGLLTGRSGVPVASGLYLFVLVTDLGTSEVGRLVIAR